jgi:integrase/recombinase XerD
MHHSAALVPIMPGMPLRASTRRPSAGQARRLPAWAAAVPGPSDPIHDDVEQYLAWLRVQRNRPATTARAYRQDLAKFAAFWRTRRPLDGGHLLAGLDREALRRYQVELAEILPNPRTRARALVALRQFLLYAHDEGWTAEDLSRRVVVPRFTRGDPHPVPTETVPRLLDALPVATLRDLRDRALVHFLISTGCRIGEALAVDRGDVRPEGFRVLGKGGKHRTVYLTEGAEAAVDDYLRRRGEDDSPALFLSLAHAEMPHGRPVPHNRLTDRGARVALNALRRRFRQAGAFDLIADLRSPHGARHTAATVLLEATEGDVRLVQEVLGHATLETLRVYTEITDHRKRDAYRRLGEFLGGGRAPG